MTKPWSPAAIEIMICDGGCHVRLVAEDKDGRAVMDAALDVALARVIADRLLRAATIAEERQREARTRIPPQIGRAH